MAQITPPSLRRYHHFILCLWQESGAAPNAAPAWRYSLENPYTAERRGFGSPHDLLAFLDQWTASPARHQTPAEENNQETPQ